MNLWGPMLSKYRCSHMKSNPTSIQRFNQQKSPQNISSLPSLHLITIAYADVRWDSKQKPPTFTPMYLPQFNRAIHV